MPKLYEIDYSLRGAPRSFIIRLEQINTADAWHWACCDAGIGYIPRSKHDRTRQMTRPEAEKAGVSEVQWRGIGLQSPLDLLKDDSGEIAEG